uniref:Zinc finger protein 641 n=1 Tax=Myotis myotis TaxID=51298 RepID=A0A7J7ZBF9_MYOMY|nr:zinc finger protein 641 [Myotis myotis]
MLSEQTAALGPGWESMNVQLDGAEPQVERGSQEEGPWRMAPGPLEHLCCDLEEEPQSLQEKAQSAPWVPAVSQEGSTGDWEMAAALLAAGSQGLVTIKDVSLCFSQEEWRSLDPSQTDFYGEYVMQENCGIVVSLRFPIPKLDMLSQLEGGEEQWVPDPQDLEERDILRVTYTGMFPGPVAGTDSLNDFTCPHLTCPCYKVSPPQPHHAPQGIKRKQTQYGDLKGLVNSLSISMSVRAALIGTLWGKASVPGGREVAPTLRIPRWLPRAFRCCGSLSEQPLGPF